MTAVDLMQLVRQRSLYPLRVHLSDGTVNEIRHPDLVMPGLQMVVIGVPVRNEAGGEEPYAQRFEFVDLRHIVKVVPTMQQTETP